jgi:hypothetical protein
MDASVNLETLVGLDESLKGFPATVLCFVGVCLGLLVLADLLGVDEDLVPVEMCRFLPAPAWGGRFFLANAEDLEYFFLFIGPCEEGVEGSVGSVGSVGFLFFFLLVIILEVVTEDMPRIQKVRVCVSESGGSVDGKKIIKTIIYV